MDVLEQRRRHAAGRAGRVLIGREASSTLSQDRSVTAGVLRGGEGCGCGPPSAASAVGPRVRGLGCSVNKIGTLMQLQGREGMVVRGGVAGTGPGQASNFRRVCHTSASPPAVSWIEGAARSIIRAALSQ